MLKETLMLIYANEIRLNCLRCDGTGKYRNEFGMMEKCESCQRADMTLEKVDAEPDSGEEGY